MQARQSGILFPARGKASTPFNGWSKSKKALDKLCSIPHWTLHDLRRTFRTNLGRLGVAPHIAERLVNHISARSEMEIVYDQYKYLPEMRQAMETYEDWLRGILGLSTGPSVMPLSFTDKQDGDEVRGVVVTQQDEEENSRSRLETSFRTPQRRNSSMATRNRRATPRDIPATIGSMTPKSLALRYVRFLKAAT